jgi:hypothetical protein
MAKTMGIFEVDFVRKHLRLEDFPLGVETGTNLGISTELMRGAFERVYTVEIEPELHAAASRRFAEAPDVECLLGDSVVQLEALLPRLGAPALFFLDAHWSGDASVNWEASRFKGYGVPTGHRGAPGAPPAPEEQVPLAQEVELIAARFPHRCAVYVDDMDKFGADDKGLKDVGFVGEDWTHLDFGSILQLLSPRLDFVARSEEQLLLVLHPLPSGSR